MALRLSQADVHTLRSPLSLSFAFQSLTIKTSSLAEAENMADLIDGYCRLQGDLDASLIVHPRGEQVAAKGTSGFWCERLSFGERRNVFHPELGKATSLDYSSQNPTSQPLTLR